uniref:Lipoyl-binding domain-containing protein n=1 Tax=Palpitomonas bilix TaxID=652834 RepID=A0A7S3GDB5_9EUKA|mmetsp:Transcript_44243/g.114953  ORF Transcript_44243/g.114953 Transcript_44243/m.114953 type:complete len:163 (+) Transcript_44243:240-728(+)
MLRSAFSTFSTTVVRPTSLVFRAYATKTYYSKTHEYIQVDGDVGTVGISDFAQESVGEVVFVDVNAVGTAVNKGEPFGAIESVKAASDVYAPVSGEVGRLLDDRPLSFPIAHMSIHQVVVITPLLHLSCFQERFMSARSQFGLDHQRERCCFEKTRHHQLRR